MSIGRRTETVFSADTHHAGEPATYSRLYTNEDTDGIRYGRFEVVVADVADGGAELSYNINDDGGYLYTSSTGTSFEHQHGVEIGYFEERVEDGRLLPMELPLFVEGSYEPQWLVEKTVRSKEIDAKWQGEFSVGREKSLERIRLLLGKTGIDTTAAFHAVYYGLALVSDGEPRLYDPEMSDRTKAEIGQLVRIEELLTEQLNVNRDISDQLKEGRSISDNEMADTYFTQARRKAHEIETTVQQLVGKAAVAPLRVLPPTGHGKQGRTWPYLDASIPDEGGAFGPELDMIRRGERYTPRRQLKLERNELRGRIDSVRRATTATIALHTLEDQDIED